MATTSRATLRHSPRTWRRLTNLALTRRLVFGTGWVGATRCGRPLACPLLLPLAQMVFGTFWPVPTPWTSISGMRLWQPTRQCAWACSICGTATFMALAAARWRPTTALCAACRPICSSWKWKVTANAWIARARPCPLAPRRCPGARAAPMASTPTFRCCTKALMWCRWSLSPSKKRATPCKVTTPCCWPTCWPKRRR